MSKLKQLQNNFTTVEQSKRLLELGLPADSADMAYQALNGKCYSNDMCGWRTCPSVLFIAKPDWSKHEWYPCWSAGRLQEIAKICAKEKEYYYASLDTVAHQEDFVKWWVKYFTLTDNVLFDFSKLED